SIDLPHQAFVTQTQAGGSGKNEMDTVAIFGTGGTFTITANGTHTTAAIAYGATASAVETELEKLTGIATSGVTQVSVTKSGNVYTITFLNPANMAVTVTADGSKLTGDTVIKTTLREKDVTGIGTGSGAVSVPDALKAVLNNALQGTGVTVNVQDVGFGGDASGHLKITPFKPSGAPVGPSLNIDWGDGQSIYHHGLVDPTTGVTSPIMAAAGGGRGSLRGPGGPPPPGPLTPPLAIAGSLQISTNFTDSSYQQLGLNSQPTRFDGVVNNDIDLFLVVNDTSYEVKLAAGNYNSVDGIVSALQGQLDPAISGIVTVQLVSPTGGGNAVEFVGKAGSVTSLSINVPHKDDGSGGEKNGAVTDLGFKAQNGSPQKSSAGGAFIRDAKLSGEITISAPTITASASLGFIGVSATGTASLVA